jgi:hypothetical protein
MEDAMDIHAHAHAHAPDGSGNGNGIGQSESHGGGFLDPMNHTDRLADSSDGQD